MSYPSLVSFVFSSFLSFALACSGGASAVPFRRFLHQPLFFPIDSYPPSASPQQQPHPKLPFSSATPQTQLRPFFPASAASPPPPVLPSPSPPPPSSYLVTFPTNISALLLPTSPSSNSSFSRRRLAAVVISISVLSATLLFALSALLLIHRRNRNTGGFSPNKSSQADGLRLVPPNTSSSSDAVPPPSSVRPPHYATTSSSSEFLYLGTLSSANPYVDVAQEAAAAGVNSSSSARVSYKKLGSPELRPLPPLPRVPTNWSGETTSFYNNNVGTKKGEDPDDNGEDEFFSPRGSTSHRESTGSPDLLPARESDLLSRFRSRSLNSKNASHPYATVYRPSQNPASSRLSLKSSLPEPILKFIAPTHVSVPRAMPMNSPTLSSSASAPQSDSVTHKSKTFTPTAPIVYPTRKPPPPPPPLVPAPRFWEDPISQDPITRPPRGAPAAPPPEQELWRSRSGGTGENSEGTPRPKLKTLHWDKLRATSDRAMAWDHINSTSFQLNEKMIETLFTGNGSPRDGVCRLPNLENWVLDPKKSQNIARLLKALNVSVDEVCESLISGNADTLGSELLESLMKVAPTKEEEQKLMEFDDESSMNLGAAEMFLRALLDVPFAFKRVDAMLYVAKFEAETEYVRRSFKTLKAACGELRNSEMFSKLLEAVLETGNRMNVGTNRGDTQVFKLDTLLELVDVKGKDGRTTLLHLVVQEVARIEESGLQVVLGLSGELANVKKAAAMDSFVPSNEVRKLTDGLTRVKDVLRMCCDETAEGWQSEFAESMREFISRAGEEIASVQAEESATLSIAREMTEYFHGYSCEEEEARPFRVFLIVKDFLEILDRVCDEVGRTSKQTTHGSSVTSPEPFFPQFIHPIEVDPPADDDYNIVP